MPKKKAEKELPCVPCGAKCCRSVVIEIDAPRRKKDYDELRWFVLHKGVEVFIDHDDKWNVEFYTPCLLLDEHHRCTGYDTRPDLCREYPTPENVCVHEGIPYKQLFTTVAEIDDYLARQAKKRRRTPARKPAEA